MNQTLIPIAFPLTPRMQSFIELRDALRVLHQAQHQGSAYTWLSAAKEVSDMLLGEGNKKPAIPTVLSLFHTMGKHFKVLSKKHSDYEENLLQAVSGLEEQADNIRHALPKTTSFLQSDAWLTAYTELIRKQDPLGHKYVLPQTIQMLWQSERQHARVLYDLIEPMVLAIEHLNQMLHAHVPWENCVAKKGASQITFSTQDNIGLLILGIPQAMISQGILPNCSGFRSIIQLRFTQWKAGEVAKDIEDDLPYALMMVPIS